MASVLFQESRWQPFKFADATCWKLRPAVTAVLRGLKQQHNLLQPLQPLIQLLSQWFRIKCCNEG
jgi:hypothetical protein